MLKGSNLNTGFTQKTWLCHWRPCVRMCVCVREIKIKSLSFSLPPSLHISDKHVSATQNSFISMHMWTYCTSEHSVVSSPSKVEVPGTSVFVREGVRVCGKRGENAPHTHSFHPSHVHRVSLNHRNTESYESNQRFYRVCVRACVFVRASESKRESVCHSMQSVGICDSH